MKHFLLPALLTGILSLFIFRCLYLRFSSIGARIALIITAFALAVPSLLFASNYVFLVPFEEWFVEFHAFPGAEATSGLAGALLGVMFASSKLRPNKINGPILIVCSAITLILVVTPFSKQILMAVNYSMLKDEWKDGVCIQTSGHTCVPACFATVIRMQGGKITEAEIAREAGTVTSGTEFWYVKRALRKYGYEPEFKVLRRLEDAPVPSILGVHIGELGHVVVLLRKSRDGIEIGEPLSGRKKYTWEVFRRVYKPNETCYIVRKR